MEVHLSHDVILYDILPRVPAQSVCRFKCVSKEWRSFLTSDMFRNKHNRLHHNKNNPKLLILYKTKISFEFITINCEAPPSVKGLTPTRRHLPSFEGISTPGICILASGYGLVCLGILKDERDYEYSDLILWNPLTNEYRRLSRSNSHKEFNKIRCSFSDFGLYYSCCEDDYKLVFVNSYDNNVEMYSLKSDSWRIVDVFQHISLLYPGGSSTRGTYLNENLYFLEEESFTERCSSIIRFDTKTERLSKIEIPDEDNNGYNYSASIMVISDCIHVCVKYDVSYYTERTTCINLWKLDESAGNMKEVVTYQLRTHAYDIEIGSLIPFQLMKNGNWLMRDNTNDQIYEVDLKKKRHIKDKGKGTNIVDEQVRYIETLVSPNRYTK